MLKSWVPEEDGEGTKVHCFIYKRKMKKSEFNPGDEKLSGQLILDDSVNSPAVYLSVESKLMPAEIHGPKLSYGEITINGNGIYYRPYGKDSVNVTSVEATAYLQNQGYEFK